MFDPPHDGGVDGLVPLLAGWLPGNTACLRPTIVDALRYALG
jgi:hypothetical protein